MKANAAVLYDPEGYSTDKARLMGRHAAGEGFLGGFFRHVSANRLYCYAANRAFGEDFARRATACGNSSPVVWLRIGRPESLSQVGTLYLPDPGVADHAWRRRIGDQRGHSIVGITHTTASFAAMDMITGLATAPVQEWDALVCTSHAVRHTVEHVLGAQEEYLAARHGAARFTRPQLPVIPLGVDTGALAPDPERRHAWRRRLGIGEADVAVLFVGRLSFHGKAHPLPMYMGLQQAARATGKRIHLVQAGWFANKTIEAAFVAGAKALCPDVRAVFLDGRRPEVRREVWHCADIFTSLSDNIQETFGLTPIEAMAAGLPCVVTDWNGYRDTVRDGVDGFRIPTLAPPPGWCEDLARNHATTAITYDVYCGHSSQLVAVDAAAAAVAYRALIEDAGLRQRFGAAARRHACEVFDWRAVIGRYQDLWGELAEKRRRAPESAPRGAGRPAIPARTEPFTAMATYPSRTLAPGDMVALGQPQARQHFDRMRESPLFQFALAAMPPVSEIEALIETLGRKGESAVAELVADRPAADAVALQRAVLWLAKMNVLRVKPPGETPGPAA